MAYQALYRKWRPDNFNDVKGQDTIVTTLRNQINADRIGHAYLFCGTRGTGKTSVAKIFAKAVNCEHPVDGNPCGECPTCKAIAAGTSMNVIEIDAASNNGVDNIRQIREEVQYSPTEGRFKVYIIDEVHMLSIGAFNALLKTLEEPPAYVIFILATTEVAKIPITILSRCQRYDFHRITIETIAARLSELMKAEGLNVEDKAIKYVAKAADGSMRDEASEPVILQGHMDMVAVKEADCDKDMEKEGLDLEINGDYISAKGTSLGGDDGIAVAYTLAVLDDEEMAHPPIEAIFTVNEEIGMLGAATIDVSDLKGRLFMNMDSEDEGVFTVSCAGGASVICKIPYETETVNASVIEIKMTGFAGGHSGVEIIKGRLNANCAMARVLLSLFNEVEMQLVSVNGGEKDNAIAKFSEASVAVLPEELEAAKQIVEDTFAQIKEEYKVTDPDAKLTVNVKEAANIETFTEDTTFAVVTAMVHMPNGVQRMNPEIEGLVQTSLNMGILTTEESEVQMTFAVRSSSETEKQYLIDQLTSLTETLGGNVEIAGPYPGWEYKADSRLREVMVEAYKHLYNGEEPVVEGIHAGLECGIFASKLPGLDAVSFGPQMEHIHTTNEVLSISSTERTWELVVKTLAALK